MMGPVNSASYIPNVHGNQIRPLVSEKILSVFVIYGLGGHLCHLINITMQSDELAHLSKVYSFIAGAFIPIFHFILNNSA